jgi:hypothetical protein
MTFRTIPGPTFIDPQTIIDQHKAGTLDVRQAVVALARECLTLREYIRQLEAS